MKKLLFLLLFLPFLGNSQATFTAPVGYNTGAPTATPSGVGTRWRFDLLTGKKYTWLPGSLSWDEDARGIDQVAGCSAPLYTPGYNQSTFAVNSCTVPELYQWTGAAWVQLNEGAVYTAGTGISIDGSNVISNTAPNVVQELSIAGQDLTLSNGGGTVEIPAGGNGIYGGSGEVPLTSRQIYVSAGYGALLKNLINDPLDASRSYDLMLPFDADTTDWQTKTYEDFTTAATVAPVGAFVNSFEEGAQYFETQLSGSLLTKFDFTNGLFTDNRTGVGDGVTGIRYTAYYPDIETNDPSLTSTQNVNSLKQKLVTYTTTQRNAIPTPATGYVIYNTDATATDGSTGVMQVWNGSKWKNAW